MSPLTPSQASTCNTGALVTEEEYLALHMEQMRQTPSSGATHRSVIAARPTTTAISSSIQPNASHGAMPPFETPFPNEAIARELWATTPNSVAHWTARQLAVTQSPMVKIKTTRNSLHRRSNDECDVSVPQSTFMETPMQGSNVDGNGHPAENVHCSLLVPDLSLRPIHVAQPMEPPLTAMPTPGTVSHPNSVRSFLRQQYPHAYTKESSPHHEV
jgi:hypothetical protein